MGNNGKFIDGVCGCGSVIKIREYTYNINVKKNGRFTCRACAICVAGKNGKYARNSVELSSRATKLWSDGDYRESVSTGVSKSWNDERKLKHSDDLRLKWSEQDYRDKMTRLLSEFYSSNPQLMSDRSRAAWSSDDYRAMQSKISSDRWLDRDYRDKVVNGIKEKWKDDDFRSKMAVVRSSMPRISSLQTTLYKYLDDLGVEYYKESSDTVFGFYSFDCLVRHNNKNLLIECQGEYWHSLENVIKNDKSKFTYISKYFPEYEIMYIWEREFSANNRIIDRIKNKLGIEHKFIDFDFSTIEVKQISHSESSEFIESYHYLMSAKSGTIFGAYLDGILTAVMVISNPIRQNVKFKNYHEISRLCIHPDYHKKNYASWFISKCLKLFKKPVFAYSDSTVGHTGTVYKASNFRFSHTVEPDYWYVDEMGYIMHKKTLYNKAKKMSLKEFDYASKYGYVKKYGGHKSCYVYD